MLTKNSTDIGCCTAVAVVVAVVAVVAVVVVVVVIVVVVVAVHQGSGAIAAQKRLY